MEKGAAYHHRHHLKCSSQQLENIDEEAPTGYLPISVHPPETPTETMQFLARSWSLSASELSKALGDVFLPPSSNKQSNQSHSPTRSPGNYGGQKHLQLHRYVFRGKTKGRRLKDQNEKKRAEARSNNAQVYAATSVAGVAAAVAAIAATGVFKPQSSRGQSEGASKTGATAAMASAAALVASQCVEMARAMGANRDQISTVIQSAVSAQTTGDIMALTAGAATALRGAAALRARLYKDIHGVSWISDREESEGLSSSLTFVFKGGELLKCTRKGDLHWKQVSIYMNSSWQVVVNMKSTHMGGTFVKKKNCVVKDVCPDVQAWLGRDVGDGNNQRAYFGIKIPERIIEFECKNKSEKQMWTEGIKQMLNFRSNTNIAMTMTQSETYPLVLVYKDVGHYSIKIPDTGTSSHCSVLTISFNTLKQ